MASDTTGVSCSRICSVVVPVAHSSPWAPVVEPRVFLVLTPVPVPVDTFQGLGIRAMVAHSPLIPVARVCYRLAHS